VVYTSLIHLRIPGWYIPLFLSGYPGGIYLSSSQGIPGCYTSFLSGYTRVLYLSFSPFVGTREPGGFPRSLLSSRFTVGQVCSMPSLLLFSQVYGSQRASFRFLFPFHCWASFHPSSLLFPFHCWARFKPVSLSFLLFCIVLSSFLFISPLFCTALSLFLASFASQAPFPGEKEAKTSLICLPG